MPLSEILRQDLPEISCHFLCVSPPPSPLVLEKIYSENHAIISQVRVIIMYRMCDNTVYLVQSMCETPPEKKPRRYDFLCIARRLSGLVV